MTDTTTALCGLVQVAARAARHSQYPNATPQQRLHLLDAMAQWLAVAEACRCGWPMERGEARQRLLMADMEAARAGRLALPQMEDALVALLYQNNRPAGWPAGNTDIRPAGGC